MRWERLKLSQAMEMGGPGKRWGHTCNAVRGGKLLYVFGGYGRDNCQTNQVHVFDTVAQSWSQPAIRGIQPSPRDSHTCTTVGDNLFIYGGTDGCNPLSDLHILDTASNSWIMPTARGDRPEAREGHSATLIGRKIFIFGGCGKSVTNSEVYYNDLYILNTENFVWQRAVTSGDIPAARHSHSCSSWKNKLVIIGGEDQYDYYLSDVHVLDADTLVWKEVNTSGQLLPPRAGHLTIPFDKFLFVFGGFSDAQNLYGDLYMLNIETGVWSKISPSGEGPSARFSMAGDCLDPAIGGALVFVGGCDKNLEALNDMYYFYTELLRENWRDDRRLEKLSLRKQLKMKCQEHYLPGSSNDKIADSCEFSDFNASIAVVSSQQALQYFHLNDYQPTVGKRTFQAKVTKCVNSGYTIETVIDGKPLRGILFSGDPSFLVGQSPAQNRVFEAKKSCEGKMKPDQEPKTDCFISREPQVQAATAFVVKDPGTLDACKGDKVVQETSEHERGLDMNLTDDKVDEVLDPDPISQKNPTIENSSLPAGQKQGVQVVAAESS